MPKKSRHHWKRVAETLADELTIQTHRVEFLETHVSSQAAYITSLRNDPATALERRDRLIRWLALPWATNDPAFPLTEFQPDSNGLPTQILTTNSDLAKTWLEVVRGKSPAPAEEQATLG